MTEPADLRVVDPGAGDAPEATDRAAWIAAGRALAAGRSETSWAFADWLVEGHRAFGKVAVKEAAETAGASPAKISHYLKTATVYPPLRRRNSLTFSHHLEVARLPEADAQRVLDAAEAEGWSHRETRAAAREASLEGKVARQRQRIAELERALKAAQTDARDAAAQAGARLGTTHRLIKEEMSRAAGVIEELAQPGMLDGLHGNARLGLINKITKSCEGIVADVNDGNARIASAVTKIKGATP